MKATTLIIAAIAVLIPASSLWAFETVQGPILYPNAHYESVGRETARMDIEACWTLARESGASESRAAKISEGAANDAASLAAAGAAAAAVIGSDPHRAAEAGAAAGGAAAFAAAMMLPKSPPPVFRGIVERCLFEKGYEVAGWE